MLPDISLSNGTIVAGQNGTAPIALKVSLLTHDRSTLL